VSVAPTGRRTGGGGVLYVVATPIGHLSDVTLRALEVLGAVPLIAAEDTRLSKRLLGRHGISARLTSFHARSAPGRLVALLEHLGSGADLALITDAGTPVVSDPGADLVTAWARAGGRVVPIPGASAVLAAVAGSGVTGPRWSFEGFLPRSGRERRDRLAAIARDERGTVLFEAPGRVAGTLRDLALACGPERMGAVCRELTKLHEQIVRGPLGALAAAAEAPLAAPGAPVGAGQGAAPTVAHGASVAAFPLRGEFVLVVGMGDLGGSAAADVAGSADAALAGARTEVERLVATGTARGDAARRVAAATGIPRRQLYAASDARDP